MVQYEYIHDGSFEFETGERMEGLGIVYHTSPDPYAPGNDSRKVIWICHALTANSDAEDWWPAFVGEGKLFDTRKYFVVCVNIPLLPDREQTVAVDTYHRTMRPYP